MGKRRVRCLLANNVKAADIRVMDSRADRCAEVTEKHGVACMADMADGLAWNPDAVIVSVPGVHHLPVLQQAVRAGKHVFCEVPLATTTRGLRELQQAAEASRLVIAPGCQPLFDPPMQQLQAWVQSPQFGPVLLINEQMGEYLPGWHPHEDYRKFYASDVRMGGCNLDVVAQSFSATCWILQRCDMNCRIKGEHVSSLEVQGVDYWLLDGRFGENGPVFASHYDLIQRAGHYSIKFISEQGTALFDMGTGTAKCYLAQDGKWRETRRPDGFSYEQCYIDEIACFIACIRGERTWPNPIEHAIAVAQLIEQMADSVLTEAAAY